MPGNPGAQSPLDDRYFDERVAALTSRSGLTDFMLDLEVALAGAWQELGFCDSSIVTEIEEARRLVTMAEVDAEEAKTDHDIAAMVNCLKARVAEAAKPFVHRGATSFDARSTAEAMRARGATRSLLLPKGIALERQLIELALQEKDIPQMGRTHGQHAEPITFGFYLAEFVDRFGDCLVRLQDLCGELIGKCSGAVGAYNQLSLYVPDPIAFEEAVMGKVGLKRAIKSTQITPPEPMIRLLHECLLLGSVLANLAWDLWHLQQTEIAEVMEGFKEGQVGSSAMPHKKNPKDSENVISLWKAVAPRWFTIYMDLVSLHQRDLTNSASARFYTEIFSVIYAMISRMSRILKSLFVDRERMRVNLDLMGDSVLSGALHQLLANYGCPDSHQQAQRLALQVGRGERGKLLELVQADEQISVYVGQFTAAELDLLSDVAKYIGLAPQVTINTCAVWDAEMSNLEASLGL